MRETIRAAVSVCRPVAVLASTIIGVGLLVTVLQTLRAGDADRREARKPAGDQSAAKGRSASVPAFG